MTCSERLEAAIRLRKPDRVPIVPSVMTVAGRWVGMTVQEFLFNPERAEAAMELAFRDLGGWDAVYNWYPFLNSRVLKTSILQVKFPGEDLPPDSEVQMFETEVMKEEDYPLLLEMGAEKFIEMIRSRTHPGITGEMVKEARDFERKLVGQEIERYAAYGVPVFQGGILHDPFDELLRMRGLDHFFVDLYRMPEMVEKAEEILVEWTIARGHEIARSTGIPRARIGAGRSTAAYIAPKMFERFVLPYWKRMLEAFSREGIIQQLAIGSNCTLNLQQMRGLPRASCILAFNSSTDIFEAKRILGDSQCIMGNVPVNLLIFGKPEEVTGYCQKLIRIVGEGGGFILGTLSLIPMEAKKENVRAMVEAAKVYGA